jgi:hypothetical protein
MHPRKWMVSCFGDFDCLSAYGSKPIQPFHHSLFLFGETTTNRPRVFGVRFFDTFNDKPKAQ